MSREDQEWQVGEHFGGWGFFLNIQLTIRKAPDVFLPPEIHVDMTCVVPQ